MKKVLIFIIPFLLGFTCPSSEVVKETREAQNASINVTFDYSFNEQNQTYKLRINNLLGNIYLLETETGVLNPLNDSVKIQGENKEIVIDGLKPGTSKMFQFFPSGYNCIDKMLYSKTVSLPYYNEYYLKSECNDFPEFQYCKKWTSPPKNDSHFYSELREYQMKTPPEFEETDENEFSILLQYYFENYIYILSGIITVSLITIFIVRKIEKKSEIDLD